MIIAALDSLDMRSIEVDVAGVAALLIAKAHKIHDRVAVNKINRLNDKDAADTVEVICVTYIERLRNNFQFLLQ